MASNFRVFWRRGRQLQRLPEFNEPIAPPVEPAGEPVSAWTPDFRQTKNLTHRRVPLDVQRNADHPATPAIPFFIAAVTPAISIKRRETRRHLRPVPQHDEWAPTTTRITHLTASVLYGQGPPTTRVTHLNVAVLYRAPRSQGHPETTPAKKGKKKKWGYISGDTSTARRLVRTLPLDTYTPTPPGFFAGFWPATKPFPTFKTEFKRTLITPLELNEYPAAAALVTPFSAYTLAIKSFTWRVDRQIQSLQLDEYPPTPPGFFAGQWPSHKPFPTFKVEFVRTRRDLPQLDEHPATPAGFFEGFFPAPFRVKRIPTTYGREPQRVLNPHVYPVTPPGFFAGQWPASLQLRPFQISFERKLQALPPLWEYPPTPPRFFEGFFPAPFRVKRIPVTYHRESQVPLDLFERPPTPPGFFAGQWPASLQLRPFQISFERSLQTVELDEFKPPPVSADNYPALTPALKANRSQFERRLQPTLDPHVYPPTPPGFFEGFFPGPFRVKRIPSTYHREAQVPLELNERPPTPAGFFDGFWPGSAGVKAFRISFERTLQALPELDEFKPPPISAEDYPALTPVPKFSWSAKRHLQATLNPHVYPPTPAGFFAGFYPAPFRVNSFKYTFERTLQTVELDEYPPTPAGFFEGFFPAPFRIKRIPSTYHRKALRVLDPHVYPPTPAGFFAGFYPGSKRVVSHKTRFDRTQQAIPQLDEYPATPVEPDMPAFTPVPTIRRRDTKRTLLQPLALNERPATPAALVPFVTPLPQRNRRASGRYA